MNIDRKQLWHRIYTYYFTTTNNNG